MSCDGKSPPWQDIEPYQKQLTVNQPLQQAPAFSGEGASPEGMLIDLLRTARLYYKTQHRTA